MCLTQPVALVVSTAEPGVVAVSTLWCKSRLPCVSTRTTIDTEYSPELALMRQS